MTPGLAQLSIALPVRTGLAFARGRFTVMARDLKALAMNGIAQAIALSLMFYLWLGVYASSDTIAGTDFRAAFLQIATAQALYAFFYTQTDWALANDIRSGQVAYYLTQPVGLQWRYFSLGVGRLGSNGLVIVPIWTIAVWLSGIDTLVQWHLLPAVVLSLAMSFVLIFCIDFMVGLSARLASSLWGVTATKDAFVLFLGGAFLPASYFPDWLQQASQWLPFRHLFLTPISLLFGFSQASTAALLVEQFTWCVALVLAARFFLWRTQRKLTIYGA